jgi:hypothetical protein
MTTASPAAIVTLPMAVQIARRCLRLRSLLWDSEKSLGPLLKARDCQPCRYQGENGDYQADNCEPLAARKACLFAVLFGRQTFPLEGSADIPESD